MTPKTISFTTFNLFNLNEPGSAIYGDTDGWDQDIYDKKIAWTQRMLRVMQADVFGFQELWQLKSLENSFEKAGLKNQYTLLSPPGHRGGSIFCAAAVRSNMLVGTPEWITEFPAEHILRSGGDDPQEQDIEVKINTFSRAVLYFQVRPNASAPVIHIFVCHLRSRRPTQIWRERSWYRKDIHGPHGNAIGTASSHIRLTAEALALRVIITKLLKRTDTPVVVLGSLNSPFNSNELNIITERPSIMPRPVRGGGDNALYDAHQLQHNAKAHGSYFSSVFRGKSEALDHILFSEQFLTNSSKRIWSLEGFEVVNAHLHQREHKTDGTNDRAILRARFRHRPMKADS